MSDKDISNKDDNKFSFIEIMINKAFELGSSAAGYLYPKLLRLIGALPINIDSNSNLSMYNSIVSNEEPNIITKSIGHGPDFWNNFGWLLQESERIGIYTHQNFAAHPVSYCGMKITDEPTYNAEKDGGDMSIGNIKA